MQTSIKLIVAALLIVIGVFIFGRFTSGKEERVDGERLNEKAIVYKSPTCGCCVGYIKILKRNNYEVVTKDSNDTSTVKEEHDIPLSMQSCHTSIIGEYFVEGHVPLEAITRLLAEKPDLDGIALPEMPAGSPGMPGVKTEEFIIYGLKDGEVREYMKI